MEENKTLYIAINDSNIEKYLNHERYEECIVNSFTGELLVPEDLYNELN